MGPILLDVNNHSNLYEAWTASMLQVIEGYNASNSAFAGSVYLSAQNGQPGHQAFKESWITKLPKVLIFSLNRVSYDK